MTHAFLTGSPQGSTQSYDYHFDLLSVAHQPDRRLALVYRVRLKHDPGERVYPVV